MTRNESEFTDKGEKRMIKYRELFKYISAIGGYFSVDTYDVEGQQTIHLKNTLPEGKWQVVMLAHPIEDGLLKTHPDEQIIQSLEPKVNNNA